MRKGTVLELIYRGKHKEKTRCEIETDRSDEIRCEEDLTPVKQEQLLFKQE